MVKHLIRFLSSLLIAGAIFALYVTQSGAPIRVHIAEGIALFIAFVIPAQFVSRFEDIEYRWHLLLGVVTSGLIVREWLISHVISKYEFHLIVIIAGLVFVTMLLMLHVLIVSLVMRLSPTAETYN